MTTESAKAGTPTPRTDAESMLHYMDGIDGTYAMREIVLADFARQLERELAAMTRVQADTLTAQFTHMESARKAEAALAACQKDAQRYQWLRNKADRDDGGHPYIALDEWYGDPGEDSEPEQTVGTHWLSGPQADQAIDAAQSDTVITNAMVDRFLSWPVPPADVYPDGVAGKPGRTGTNLLTAVQAREMLEYALTARPKRAEGEEGRGSNVDCGECPRTNGCWPKCDKAILTGESK